MSIVSNKESAVVCWYLLSKRWKDRDWEQENEDALSLKINQKFEFQLESFSLINLYYNQI